MEIFACRDSQERAHAFEEALEICVLVQQVAELDVREHVHSHDRVNVEKQQEERANIYHAWKCDYQRLPNISNAFRALRKFHHARNFNRPQEVLGDDHFGRNFVVVLLVEEEKQTDDTQKRDREVKAVPGRLEILSGVSREFQDCFKNENE